jgi:uncharacterized membrane protein HdeD (DUF308 family)
MKNRYLVDGVILLFIGLMMFILHRWLLAIPALVVGICLGVWGVLYAISPYPENESTPKR